MCLDELEIDINDELKKQVKEFITSNSSEGFLSVNEFVGFAIRLFLHHDRVGYISNNQLSAADPLPQH